MEPSSSSATTTSSLSPSSQRGGGRELQGPRPAPLRVRKESHKIRKPPPPQVREPVIIYTVSPKVVHADPSEFMSVVQRLTGGTASSSSSVPAAAAPHHHQIIQTTPALPFPFFGGAPAPSSSSAALLPPPPFPFQQLPHELMTTTETEISPAARSSSGSGLLMPPPFPGILSPGFFSPPPPGPGINLFGGLISPAAAFLGAAAAGTSATSAAGHQNLMSLQQEASPSSAGPYYWGDLFNNQHYHQN